MLFLLPNLGLSFLDWGNLWPLYIVLCGSAFLAGWAMSPRHEPGLAFVGTGALLTGIFLAPFAWEMVAWERMAVWWPIFPLIGGLAFLALWAADRGKDPGILVPAGGGILTGLVALFLTTGWLSAAAAAKWWPAGLITLGVAVLFGRTAGGKA